MASRAVLGRSEAGDRAVDRPPPRHGLDRACVAIWTDDVDAARRLALAFGATDNPRPYAYGRFSIAFVEDPDGHPRRLVQKPGLN